MSVNWSNSVNSKFYNLSYGVNDNTEKVSFESGKSRSFLKNSKPTKTFNFSLSLWNGNEEQAFWNWYDNDLLSGSETFVIPDLITHSGSTEYKMTSTPSVSEGAYPLTVSISCEEY